MPYTPTNALSSTPYRNFAETSIRNNSGLPQNSNTQSRNESGRDGRNSKAFPNRATSMERQEAKEISDRMSRSQTKGNDEKRESTSSPYDSLYLKDNNAIPDTSRRQTENVGTNESETSSSSPWTPSTLTRAILTPRQHSVPSKPWRPWVPTQTAPDLAGEFCPNVPTFRQLAVHSIVNPPEKDEVLKSKPHHSSSGEDFMEPTKRGVLGPPKFENSMDESEKEEAVSGTPPLLRPIDYTKATEHFDRFASVVTEAGQFLEATSTNFQENANEGSWKLLNTAMRERLWHMYDPPIPLVQSSTSTNPFVSSPRYSLAHNPTPSPRGYYRTDYPPYSPPFGNGYPFATTPSPRYMDATERRESPSERFRRARSARSGHGPTPSPRPETIKRTPRYTSEEIYPNSYEFNALDERRRSAWAEHRARRRRENLSLTTHRYSRSYDLYHTTKRPKGPTQCKLWSKKHVPKETEDVQFQYQNPPQPLSKPQDNGANSRGRILAQRRKKRSPGKTTQHSPLGSSFDLSASTEKRSREDESPSRTEPQLRGRHQLSNWKLHNGKSKDWRRKPSAKTLTARKFLSAIYSHKQLHYSTVHAEGPGMAGFGPDIPVAAQRSRRGKISMAVRNEFPAFLPWLDRKGFRDMGAKRDHMREIFDEGEFEVEAHRNLGLRPELPEETYWHVDVSAYFSESNRQLQFLQACPSAKINQDANHPQCLQIQYIGRVIPSPYGCFQLSEHIESSAHAEVYKICYLYTGLESFARIYTLRGIHPNQRKRRVENLKKFSQLNKLLIAFDWGGEKVCVISYRYKTKYMSLFEKDSTPKAAGIGAIGRRNTKEYDAAFPPLPPSTPIPVPTKAPEEATEPPTPEQQLRIKTLEVIKSEIEETSPKRWKSISKEPLPLAQRLMIRLMDLNGESVAKRNSEWQVRDCGDHWKNEGNRKWNEDGKGKNLEAKIKKKRGRKKKSEKGFIVRDSVTAGAP